MSGTAFIGKPIDRVDGPAKVSGGAKYAGEFNQPGLTYGVAVSSAIACGKILKIDPCKARDVPGVLDVYWHEHRPDIAGFDRSYRDDDAPMDGSPFRPLYDDNIAYSGQPIAFVVAETFEAARYAARLVEVTYAPSAFETRLDIASENAFEAKPNRMGIEPPPKPRGQAEGMYVDSPVKIDREYSTPVEHHNPMEPFASTVIHHDDGWLTIYDKTQGVTNSLNVVHGVFGVPKKKIQVLSPFVGGAFGSGLRPQYQLILAVMAALDLKRSVRATLTRDQMFTFGHRPETRHRLRIGASNAGQLLSLRHATVSETSRYENNIEAVVNWSGQQYRCDNVSLQDKIAAIDTATPLDMRAPGAVLGIFALESAMDELASAVDVDPVALRLLNYAERDQNKDVPFSSNEIRECYRQGAERFGWSKRNATPRSVKRGTAFVGMGMAAGAWEAPQMPASAPVSMTPDGRVVVASGTADIGTGTYTVMTQIAAEMLGVPLDAVTARLGDTSLPSAPLEGGSWTVSSVGSAVKLACEKLGAKLLALAQRAPESPLAHLKIDDVAFVDGRIVSRADQRLAVSLADALAAGDGKAIDVSVDAKPDMKEQMKHSISSHSAVFAEVEVDADFGTVKVTRIVSAIAGGRVMNAKTARSQIVGGIVWGISMALQEHSVMDHQFGRFMNHNFAEYHVPVNKDIHDIDVIFVEEHDTIVNPLGAKGLGEIGIVGVAAAIANAVYNATGKRVRDLPITLDKLI